MIKTLQITSVIAAILAGVFIVFPVIYGVRGDKQVFLFSIKPEFQSDLDNETISEELLKEFERNYRPLLEDTTVSVQEAGKEWIIANEANEVNKSKKYSYSIIKTDLDLRIYESFGQFENSSVKDQFSNTTGNIAKTSMSQESPLVKQANAFAEYLDPEKPAVRKVTKGAKIPGISSKVNVTPKFPILATIVYPDDPTLSQALINEPGKGRHWVRQSSMVGHLFVEQVSDGHVVLKSGDETYNIEISEKAETGSTGKPSTASSLSNSRSSIKPQSTAFSRAAAAKASRTRNIPTRTQKSSSDEERAEELVDKLKDLQQHSVTDNADSKLDPEEQEQRKARIQELISKFKATRVSAEESKKLDNMGEELKGIEEDPNSSQNEADESEGKVSPSKTDTSTDK